ncbi:hypothetical protein J1N35_038149 [Gossypium stocksii]|uniref:MULE transposase domain-containing protein n=1 Tax=Gossypium stocksii TaxID=47602 RepID=A0A9D3ULC3_9ROSI|nr:hypothetical protein J1N35_038149 [Gossypium stocksii]
MFLLTAEEGDVEWVEFDGKGDLERVESVGKNDVGEVQVDGEGVFATGIEDNDSKVAADEYVSDFVTSDGVDHVADEYASDFVTSNGVDNVTVASSGEEEDGNKSEVWDSDEHRSLVSFDEDEEHKDAVGRDANNQMFPIAWAVVEVEYTDSWAWFLSLLSTDLDLEEGYRYTIINDQQKGLEIAISDILPRVEHRNCVRFKNIIKMLEDIRTKMMTRIVQKRKLCNRWNQNYGPLVKAKFDANKKDCVEWQLIWNGENGSRCTTTQQKEKSPIKRSYNTSLLLQQFSICEVPLSSKSFYPGRHNFIYLFTSHMLVIHAKTSLAYNIYLASVFSFVGPSRDSS